jgi:Holliday junction DNA helicase RuvB
VTDERAKDLGDVSPSALSHLIGQRSVVEQVKVALDSAQQDGQKFDHALLVGPPGCGKTQTAKVIAQEMAAEFHEVLGQAISGPGDLNALLLGAKDRDVVLIDEAHELPKEQQTALYLGLDQRRVFLQGGKTGLTPQSIPVADFTLLLSTTDEYRLLQPLRDRMRLVLRFEFYAVEELVELLRQRCQALQWRVDAKTFLPIAERSRGTPRLALRLLQACRRVCRSEGEGTITTAHLKRACQLEQIDDLGLGPIEQQYLQVLVEGANRLNVIASRLGLPTRTITEVTEQFLIRAGLMLKDEQGRRQLTAEGREHLSQSAKRIGRPL